MRSIVRLKWLLALSALGGGCGTGTAITPDSGTGNPDAAASRSDAGTVAIDASSVDAGVLDPVDEVDVITAVGTPTGAQVSQTLDAAGGSAAEATSGATVTAVPGSLGGPAQVTLTPVTNLLPGGVGDGVAIAVTGAAGQSKPLLVQFHYGDDVPNPSLMVLAIQRDDGSWVALTPMRIDAQQRTLSAALPDLVPTKPARAGRRPDVVDVSSRTVVKYLGYVMKPGSATVKTKGTLGFTPYATISQQRCEDQPVLCTEELCQLVKPKCSRPVIREVPFTNDKPGYIRTWTVNGSLGGDSTVGTIQPNPSAGAIYTAPATRPAGGTVTVEFTSVNQQTSAITTPIQAQVKIVSGGWMGTSRSESSEWNTDTEVTWTPVDGPDPDVVTYEPSGTVTISNFNGEQFGCSLSPLSGAIGPADGQLVIDFGQDPPTYAGFGVTDWDGTLACPGGSMGIPVGDVWFGNDGATVATLSADGTMITGGWTSADGSLSWTFQQL